MRRIHFIGGLPRSGSTLLTNILLQNPKFQTTATSSLLEFLLQVRDNWNKLEGHSTYPDGQDKWNVIRAILQSYHMDIVLDYHQYQNLLNMKSDMYHKLVQHLVSNLYLNYILIHPVCFQSNKRLT